jgi:hypothetical protein
METKIKLRDFACAVFTISADIYVVPYVKKWLRWLFFKVQ